jgi:type I restriction enzyme S subunit
MIEEMRSVQLAGVLHQQKRVISVDPEREYQILGTHWYAKGLYIKDVKAGLEIKAAKLNRVCSGDFVYNRLFAWKGAFAVAEDQHEGCYVSNEFPCFEIDAEVVEPLYLLKYFSQEQIWHRVYGLSHGATSTSRNRLREAALLSLKIALPSLSEQREITNILQRVESIKVMEHYLEGVFGHHIF